MNIQKSIQYGLLIREYKTKKAFAEDKGLSQGMLSRLSRNSQNTKIGTIKAVADAFEVPVSTFIEWGEQL
ncbi:MAG: helix-turn-helix domain-containing protein [Vibrio gallaecicus]